MDCPNRYALALLAAALLLQSGCNKKEAAETTKAATPIVQTVTAEQQLTDE